MIIATLPLAEEKRLYMLQDRLQGWPQDQQQPQLKHHCKIYGEIDGRCLPNPFPRTSTMTARSSATASVKMRPSCANHAYFLHARQFSPQLVFTIHTKYPCSTISPNA
jgi:hypothetical protein